VTINTTFEGSL